jgi:dipeptidyl aminopeptidase/acylaminoacyl peptidase
LQNTGAEANLGASRRESRSVEFRMPVIPIHRRDFLRGTAAFTALPFAGWGRAAAAEAALVARKVFFDNPDVGSVRISPDGQTLAWLAPIGGVRNLFVAPLSDLAAARAVTHATDRNLAPFYRWAHTNRHLVFFQERDGDENWRASSVDIMSGAIVPLTPERGVKAYWQEADRKFPDQMLFKHNARDRRYFDLFRVNIVTGASQMLFENNEFAWYVTDSDFQLRLGVRFVADGSAENMVRRPDGTWEHFLTVPVGDLDSTQALDFSADGKTLYVRDTRDRDKAALFVIDMATRKATLLASDDEADINHVDLDFTRRIPLAARANKDRVRWHAVDPGAAQDLADLANYGPGDVEIIERSADNRFATVFYERDSESGEYALLDRQARKVRSLFKQRKALAGLALQKMQPVVIPARDGLRLNGYLTLPGAGSGKVPMVLLIHGGPYLRDVWGFNSVHQWLANRGYAVLSVNYRGSTGFGKAFVIAADKEWGGKMHDDLIDAVDWAVGQGIADPKRVGFFGASYGGYSALTAATKTPEVFACIVDVFGISNLITFMATIPPYWGPWFSIWKNRLGDPATEAGRAFLTERSPLTHIDRAVRPILIAQGMQDVRVVAAESEQMVAALKKRGVPVTYITFADEGHGFARPENRLAFYAVTESFLAKHLGGLSQPVGEDFAGSSLQVETGGELVPGLAG